MAALYNLNISFLVFMCTPLLCDEPQSKHRREGPVGSNNLIGKMEGVGVLSFSFLIK